jgi:transcriptional regulator with GAF, ATPase, and Fis domain
MSGSWGDSLRALERADGAFERIGERRIPGEGSGTEAWRRLLVGQSPAIERVAKIIRLVAPRRCTLLISGETGSGKEMVARAIHMAGDRSRRPMISVNCGALPENLIEAELFGHVKGAFTGATEHRAGRFEQAQGGTLFLDEIGDLPYDLQAKLLRVLQEREIQKLGGTGTIKVDVRVIAATNANLLGRVQQGSFREDLYYRLNVVPVDLPSLRERDGRYSSAGKSLRSQGVCGGGAVRQVGNFTGNGAYLCLFVAGQCTPVGERRRAIRGHECLWGFAGHLRFCAAEVSPTRARRPHPVPRRPASGRGHGLLAGSPAVRAGILDQALTKTQGNKTLAAFLLRLPRTTLIHKLRALECSSPPA